MTELLQPTAYDRATAPPVSPTGEVLAPLAEFSRRTGHVGLAQRLGELHMWLGLGTGELDAELRRLQPAADADATLAERAAGYLLSQPGKRIRPLCVVLGAALGGRAADPAVSKLAAACELVHNATLLHDDVIDEGTQRRGAPSARIVFGNSASILAGDHMLVESLRLVESAGHVECLMPLLDVISEIVHAEAKQLAARCALLSRR